MRIILFLVSKRLKVQDLRIGQLSISYAKQFACQFLDFVPLMYFVILVGRKKSVPSAPSIVDSILYDFIDFVHRYLTLSERYVSFSKQLTRLIINQRWDNFICLLMCVLYLSRLSVVVWRDYFTSSSNELCCIEISYLWYLLTLKGWNGE